MLTITIAGKNESRELKAKEQLERILKQYDLEKYFFTDEIIFESFTIPHSHPILTLNTRQLDNDDRALSVFLHEELHWYLNQKAEEREKAIEELREIYPKAPVGNPEGAKDEYSSYEHLLVNFLEFEALKELIGKERAVKVIKSFDYYKWIYKKVLEDHSKIQKIALRHTLC